MKKEEKQVKVKEKANQKLNIIKMLYVKMLFEMFENSPLCLSIKVFLKKDNIKGCIPFTQK